MIWFRKRGRKPLSDELRSLIIELKTLNHSWGGQRISDELKKIGIFVSKRTVLKVLSEEGLNSPPPHRNLKWSEYFQNHNFIIGIDFTSVFSLWGKQFFVLVILDLKSRVLLHINATFHPNREWLVQQFKNAFLDIELEPTLCLADHDGIYGLWLKPYLKSHFGMALIQIPYRKPKYNGRVERFHRSLKQEALNDIVPISLAQLQKVCGDYKKYYNSHRCHQAINGQIPANYRNGLTLTRMEFTKKKHLNGRITSLEPVFLAAA